MVLDDRATFFTSHLRAGQPLKLTYALDATTGGVYTAPGTVVYSRYGPPLRYAIAPPPSPFPAPSALREAREIRRTERLPAVNAQDGSAEP